MSDALLENVLRIVFVVVVVSALRLHAYGRSRRAALFLIAL